MPTIGWGHSHFWQTQTAAPPDPAAGASVAGGYVPFQTSVIFGSMFGGLQPVWQWVVTRVTSKKDSQ